MDRERYFHYPTKCPHCGSFNIGGGLHCCECGNFIHMPRILTYLEKYIEFKAPQTVHKSENIERIFACEFEQQPFGYRYMAMRRVGAGDLAIDFCGCPTCNRLLDEILDYFVAFETAYNPERFREWLAKQGIDPRSVGSGARDYSRSRPSISICGENYPSKPFKTKRKY